MKYILVAQIIMMFSSTIKKLLFFLFYLLLDFVALSLTHSIIPSSFSSFLFAYFVFILSILPTASISISIDYFEQIEERKTEYVKLFSGRNNVSL